MRSKSVGYTSRLAMAASIGLLGAWLLPVHAALATEQVAHRIPFQLSAKFGDRKTYSFAVTAPGRVALRARWSGGAPLALILNGPGQTGYHVRKDGSSPLKAVYTVTRRDLAKRGHWTASIVNFSKQGPVRGVLVVSYPAASVATSPAMPRFYATCVDRNRGVSVQVDMNRGTGTFYMNHNNVFALRARYLPIRGADPKNLIELKGNGARAFHLNVSRKILFFREGTRGEFCKLRIEKR